MIYRVLAHDGGDGEQPPVDLAPRERDEPVVICDVIYDVTYDVTYDIICDVIEHNTTVPRPCFDGRRRRGGSTAAPAGGDLAPRERDDPGRQRTV